MSELKRYLDDGMYAEGSLALILRLCRCAGVAPLRASRAGAGWRFRVSTSLAVLQAAVTTIINLILLASLILELNQNPDNRVHAGKTTLQAFVWAGDVVLLMVYSSLAVYSGPAQMKSLQRVLGLLQQIKIDLNMSDQPARMERIKGFAIVTILLWMISVMTTSFILHLIEIKSKDDEMWMIVFLNGIYYVADMQGMLAIMKWASTVLAVREGAAALNKHLERLQHGSKTSSLPPQADTMIRRCAVSHERMSNMMNDMNDTNGLFLITVLLAAFLRLVITPYYMLVRQRVYGLPLALNWNLVHLITLLLVVEPCHWTHTQREQTASLLGRLTVYLAPKSELISKELDQFSKQLSLCNTKFSTLGVYTLNRQLTAAFLGGATTYLVILIQFPTIPNV